MHTDVLRATRESIIGSNDGTGGAYGGGYGGAAAVGHGGLTARGAFVDGLSLQGARWDVDAGCLASAAPRELFCPMRTIDVRAVLAAEHEEEHFCAGPQGRLPQSYRCPAYKTTRRGPGWVFCATLRTETAPARWVLAGVALLFDVE